MNTRTVEIRDINNTIKANRYSTFAINTKLIWGRPHSDKRAIRLKYLDAAIAGIRDVN